MKYKNKVPRFLKHAIKVHKIAIFNFKWYDDIKCRSCSYFPSYSFQIIKFYIFLLSWSRKKSCFLFCLNYPMNQDTNTVSLFFLKNSSCIWFAENQDTSPGSFKIHDWFLIFKIIFLFFPPNFKLKVTCLTQCVLF